MEYDKKNRNSVKIRTLNRMMIVISGILSLILIDVTECRWIAALFFVNIVIFMGTEMFVLRPLNDVMRCIKEDCLVQEEGCYEFRCLAQTYNAVYKEKAAYETLLVHRAEQDQLTGLMNRGAFDRLKTSLMESRDSLALMLMDIDHFKQINDEYGHEAGDEILRKVALFLEKSFDGQEYLIRLGGDEFVVIIRKMTPEQKDIIEERINCINEALKSPSDGLPPVSLSVGVAFSDHGFHKDLYRMADRALYFMKEDGRCGCRFCQEEERNFNKI